MNSASATSAAAPRPVTLSGALGYRRRAIASGLLTLLLGAMVLTPIGALIAQSLLAKDGSWTAAAWSAVYTDPTNRAALANTLTIIGLVELIAVTLGTALAWFLTSCDLPGRKWLLLVPLGPLLFPPLLSALGWIFLMSPGVGFLNVALRALFDLPGDTGPMSIYSMAGIAWVMGIYAVPFVYAVVAPAMENLDTRLDEAAAMSGANRFTTVRTVTLKLLLPAIVGGALFAFIVSASEFTIPLLIGTRAHIDLVSTRLYELVTSFPVQFAQGAALAMGLMVAVAAITVLQRWVTTRRSVATLGAKGARRVLVDLGAWRWPAAALIVFYLLVTVVLPLGAIVVVSLLPYWQAGQFDWTLDNYAMALFRQPGALTALSNSVLLAAGSATCAVLLAIYISHVTLRDRGRINNVLDTFAALPMGVPSIVFGTGMLIAFLHSPVVLYGTLASLLIAYVAHTLPITLRPVTASYVQLDTALVEAAGMCGASGGHAVADIVVPLLRGAILSAWGLTFILLLREMPLSIMLTTPGNNVISTFLFNLYDGETFPSVAALAVIMFATGAVVFAVVAGIAWRWRRRANLQGSSA